MREKKNTDEIAELRANGHNYKEIAYKLGCSRTLVQQRIKAMTELGQGDVVYEIQTGHKWEVSGPGTKPGCVRVSTEGGGNSMDMSVKRLSRKPPQNKPSEPVTVFSVARGDDPAQFRELIDRQLKLRASLDQPVGYSLGSIRCDPDANLRATQRKKYEEWKAGQQ